LITIPLDKQKIRETLDIIAKEFGHSSYKDYVQKRCSAKSDELIYIKDPTQKAKRIMTGDLGELVACKVLEYKAVPDLRIGNTSQFNHPDLKSLGLGVKCVNAPLAHMINRNINHPQILITIDGDHAIIHGVFSPEVLKSNLDDSLIKTKASLERKSGFNRYDLGKPLDSILR
jgi:hypothetical protein